MAIKDLLGLSNSHTFNLVAGKQYISMPVLPEDRAPIAVFGAGVEVKGYDSITGWYTPSELEAGKGYLVRSGMQQKIKIKGEKVNLTQADIISSLLPGWNLVGCGADKIDLSGTGYVAAGYNPETDTEYATSILKPGGGYWIEVI